MRRKTTNFLTGTVCVLLTLCALPTAANEKRVTVPIALPFQQQASSAASFAPPAQALQATPFTQSLPASAAAVSSAMPATQALSPAIQSLSPAQAAPANAQPLADTAVVASQVASSAPAPASATKPTASTTKPAASTTKAASPKASATAAKPAAPREPKFEDETDPLEDPASEIPVITTAPVDAPRYPAGHPESFVAEFENYVAKKVAPFVPGVAIVVVSGGQIKSLQGYGVRRAGTREKITPDTVFRLASLSKAFAATAASELVREGRITWDTPVTSVLTDVSFKNARYGKQLTLQDVLSQASGLPRHTYSHFVDENMAYAEIVRRLRYVNFVCPPGKCYAYQNVSYSLAGDMIKKKSGMTFEKYVGENIFTPLGMRSASYGLNNYNASPNRASPHINNGSRWIPTAVTGNWYRVAPAAGVNASITDMSKFLLGQMGKRQDALPLEVLNPIQSRITKNTPAQNYYGVRKAVDNTAYGMGWRVFDYGRYKNFIHHGGHVKGFRTEMVFNRDLQIGMVFLTNSESRFAKDIIFRFLDMYEQSHHPTPKAKAAAPAKAAAKPSQAKPASTTKPAPKK
jgi:beta-lactamase class C